MNTWLNRWLGNPRESAGSVEAWMAAAASTNGYERQQAVEALARSDDPRALRVLLVRANDWVPQVRQAAAEAVLAWLDEHRLDGWRQALPALWRLRGAGRVDHRGLLEAVDAFLSAPSRLQRLGVGVPASDREAGRFLFQLSLKAGHAEAEMERVLVRGVASGDVWVARMAASRLGALATQASRSRAAAEACRSVFGEVRAAGLRSMSAGGQVVPAEWLNRLCFDERALVRQLALSAATSAMVEAVQLRALAVVGNASKPARERVVSLKLLRELRHPAHRACCEALIGCSSGALRAVACEGLFAETDADLPALIERALVDAAPAVQRLAVKAVQRGAPAPSAQRVRQLVEAVPSPRSMRVALQLMSRASPWDRLWFVLATLADSGLSQASGHMVDEGLLAWCEDMGRCFVVPAQAQKQAVREAWQRASALVAEPLRAQVLFQLQSFGIVNNNDKE